MKRKIIRIDEELCNGCGDCVTSCAEGALAIIDGKARLIRDDFCDGFGDCVGQCPVGALTVIEEEAPEFDVEGTRAHLARTGGDDAVRRFEEAHARHAAGEAPAPKRPVHHHHAGGGCPGSMMRFDPDRATAPPAAAASGSGLPARLNPSELAQWPIQIHLVHPAAPFFKGRELVVMNTCGPLASADVHWRFLRGRSVVVGCPKLDETDGYVEKIAAILAEPSIPRVLVVRMEVPCCGGLTAIVREAVAQSGRADLAMEEIVLGLDGAVR